MMAERWYFTYEESETGGFVAYATMAWGRRIGFDWSRLGADDAVNDDEERLAYVHGKLCRDFVARAIDAGLYEAES